LGTITVAIRRVRVDGLSEDQTFRAYDLLKSNSVNEKAKKALLTHSIEYDGPSE